MKIRLIEVGFQAERRSSPATRWRASNEKIVDPVLGSRSDRHVMFLFELHSRGSFEFE